MPTDWGKSCPRILILGAGCTGLGAAYRLHELGYTNFQVLEQNSYPGGLAASFVDDRGFTWDLGGHVQFSHYKYFDQLMDRALGAAWLHHLRQSYIWIRGKFVPYPFQNNLRHLPPEDLARCLKGLIRARDNGHTPPANFHDWIVQSFGDGIADLFLLPYNVKVWAHPLEMMSYRWVGERVATVDLERVIENVIIGRDDPGWGPNNTFRFPESGGTGAIWKAVAGLIPERHFAYSTPICHVEPARHRIRTGDGTELPYDILISTLPLDVLSGIIGADELKVHTDHLKYSTTHVVGIGLTGQAPPELASKNWMYFPEGDCPFYRVTVLSNYSPKNVPDSSRCWSLMAEVAESRYKLVNRDTVIRDVIRGLKATRLIRSEEEVASIWHRRLERGYPIPTCDRDEHIGALSSELEKHSIYSRGRFGAWKYEVANQDHTCMQGVEFVNRLLFDVPEMTLTYPSVVNQTGMRKSAPRPPGPASPTAPATSCEGNPDSSLRRQARAGETPP
jgi:protoporphyrinogen oxidase